MTPQILVFSILLIASLIVLVPGYLIKTRKQLSLIAGLDVSKVKDKDALASTVGGGLQTLGLVEIAISFLLLEFQTSIPLWIGLFIAASLIGFVYIFISARRYFN